MVGVYIVDDSKLFVNELTLTVPWAELGCRVVGSAVNAFDAEREIRERRPDLVITDISMPERSGLELIERLGVRLTVSVHGIPIYIGQRVFKIRIRAEGD